MAMASEMEKILADILICPKPCNDGTVEITISSGLTKTMPCPVIASDCLHGERMEQALDRYVTGVMSNIGVPCRHLENFTEMLRIEALEEVGKWQWRGFLIITGKTGSGKSFSAARAVHKYLRRLADNRFDNRTWGNIERAGNSIVWCAAMDISCDRDTSARAKCERLAVIDDLGDEPDTSLGQSSLCGVILKRHDMKLPTVITTTLTMMDIDVRYGCRVADKLTEDIGKGGMIVEFGDASIRAACSADRRERI